MFRPAICQMPALATGRNLCSLHNLGHELETDRCEFEHVLYHTSRHAHFADAGPRPFGDSDKSHAPPLSNPFSNLYDKIEPIVTPRSMVWYHDVFWLLIEMQETTKGACNIALRAGTASSPTPTFATTTMGPSGVNLYSGDLEGKYCNIALLSQHLPQRIGLVYKTESLRMPDRYVSDDCFSNQFLHMANWKSSLDRQNRIAKPSLSLAQCDCPHGAYMQ